MHHEQNIIVIGSRRRSVVMCVVGACGCGTMSATTSNSKGSKKRGSKDTQPVGRDQSVLCVLQKHCTDDEVGYLIVQQETGRIKRKIVTQTPSSKRCCVTNVMKQTLKNPLYRSKKCSSETSAPSRLQLGSWDSLLTSDFQRVLHCLHDCLDFQRVLHCLHDCLSGGTKRRSSWACIGNPNPEQETSKGTHAQETSANQRRPTTQHAAQGSNPPIGARLFKWRVLAQC